MIPERANLRAAVAGAQELGEQAAVVELAWDVVVLYFVCDAVDEPDAWLRRVAEAAPTFDELTDAKLRSLHALTRVHHGDYDGAEDALHCALAVFEARAMDFERAVVLHQLAFVRYHLAQDVTGAIDMLRTSSSLFAGLGHDWGVSLAEAMLGSLLAAEDDLAAAERHQVRSLEHAQRLGSDQQAAQALSQIALLRLRQERYDDAVEQLNACSARLRHGRYRTDTATALEALAVVVHHRGDDDSAAIAATVASAERARLGVEPWPTLRPFIDGTRRALRRSLGDDQYARIAASASTADIFETFERTLQRANDMGKMAGRRG